MFFFLTLVSTADQKQSFWKKTCFFQTQLLLSLLHLHSFPSSFPMLHDASGPKTNRYFHTALAQAFALAIEHHFLFLLHDLTFTITHATPSIPFRSHRVQPLSHLLVKLAFISPLTVALAFPLPMLLVTAFKTLHLLHPPDETAHHEPQKPVREHLKNCMK